MKLPKTISHFFQSLPFGIDLMDRYIAMELIPPLFFSAGIFSALGVAVGYLSDLANKVFDYNLPLLQAGHIFLLKVPQFIAYALPISLLLATLMAYGRLSNDSELISLQGCGVSFNRIVAPAVVISFLVTGITFVINEFVVPPANYQSTAILVKYLKEEHPFWQNKDIFYPNYEELELPDGEKTRILTSLFYAENFDGEKMKSLTILKWLGQHLEQIVLSDSATWNAAQNTWDFFNGTIYKIAADASYKGALSFQHQQLPLPKEPFEFALKARNPDEMSIFEAWEYMKILRLSGDTKRLISLQVRSQQKLAFPFVCLVFGLVGAVLGARPKQMSKATSFGITLGITFGYYVLNFVSSSFGIIGILTPFMSAWLPNFLGLGVALWLLLKNE
jgi:lipopolysaccharide export system permease protein